jgi:integrase
MASLQARHQRSCKLYPWTPFAKATRKDGCTCTPLYHVALRHDGRLVREPVGHNRKEAERALDARRGDLARKTYRVFDDVRFDEWADRFLAGFTGKETTRRAYAISLTYAKGVFGASKVRDLGVGDVRRYLDRIRDETLERRSRNRRSDDPPAPAVSPATLAKHLRTLGACLQAAVVEGYANENPVRRLHKSARPKVAQSRPAYYTNAELARIWPELAERPVMVALCKTAVATGLRFGELAAIRWTDVDLLNREMHVRRTFVEGLGEQAPKSGESRTIDLTPPAAAVLEHWYKIAGDDGLVFEHETGGYLSSDDVRKYALYPALERAGVPRIGESGRKRDFHSFRHTFARIALEGGAEITWVKEQLGHSSITLTVDLYGHWSRASKKAQAERLADAFVL